MFDNFYHHNLRPPAERLRIIVSGLVGLHPVGGVAWDYLQYVLGLAHLGHDVYYHEDTWRWPYNPLLKSRTDDASYSAAYLSDFFHRYAPGLSDRWHYLHLHDVSYGMSRRRFDEIAGSCDLYINVSGANLIPDGLPQHCVKVFLDTDPGYNQIIISEKPKWEENVHWWCQSVDAYDRHFTYGENMSALDCEVPTLGYRWLATRMPIVTDLWQRALRTTTSPSAVWTTVMTWNAYKGPLIYQGVEYKGKGGEFEKITALPRATHVPLLLAVGGITTSARWLKRIGWKPAYRGLSQLAHSAKFRELKRLGWQVVDGPSRTLSPSQYREFIAASRGEVSTAKDVYVALRTGWFSCRSACYLAAGRPVVVQDTGFTSILPCGEGILPFQTLEQCVSAIRAVEEDYERHALAAYQIAREHFDSARVLERFIDDAFATEQRITSTTRSRRPRGARFAG